MRNSTELLILTFVLIAHITKSQDINGFAPMAELSFLFTFVISDKFRGLTCVFNLRLSYQNNACMNEKYYKVRENLKARFSSPNFFPFMIFRLCLQIKIFSSILISNVIRKVFFYFLFQQSL